MISRVLVTEVDEIVTTSVGGKGVTGMVVGVVATYLAIIGNPAFRRWIALSHLFLLLFSYASSERQPRALSIGVYFVHNRPTPCAYSALTALAIRNPFGLVIP